MEANELMIGDWVYDTILQGYTRVKVLTARGIKGDIHDNIWDEKTFEPIPLTPEILEKNGFKFDGSGQCSMMFLSEPHFSEGQRFNIYVGLKHKTIDVFVAHPIMKSPNWRKTNRADLEVCGPYVHQLQQALRLCGIEKEIEL